MTEHRLEDNSPPSVLTIPNSAGEKERHADRNDMASGAPLMTVEKSAVSDVTSVQPEPIVINNSFCEEEKWRGCHSDYHRECNGRKEQERDESLLTTEVEGKEDRPKAGGKRPLTADHSNLSEKVRLVMQDQTKSPTTKTKEVQQLYCEQWQRKREKVDVDRRGGKIEGEARCKHYSRHCWLKAKCCQKLYACRLCHDEVEDHKIDRQATEEVVCMRCNTCQAVSESCTNCKERFARYFCNVCKFYDDKEGKDIYHCPHCNMCRVGKGLGIDNYHCNKCRACVSMASKDKHKCLEASLDANCPICHDYLFTSVEKVIFMRCGHTMHHKCFEEYTKNSYVCPLCHQSLADMTNLYRRIDKFMDMSEGIVPAEYSTQELKIFCNECFNHSIVPFHFMYYKCGNCNGYNTSVIRTVQRPVGAEAEGTEVTAEVHT